METPHPRDVTLRTRLEGASERLEIRDAETGRVLALRPDLVRGGDGSSEARHEAILSIARVARWRVDHVLLGWRAPHLHASVALASGDSLITLETRPSTAIRMALDTACPVRVEPAAWDELARRAAPISNERVRNFAMELVTLDDILRELGQGPLGGEAA